MTRRTFAAALTAWGIRAGTGTIAPRTPETDTWAEEESTRVRVERKYRVTAQVLVLGMPVFRREDVGAGNVIWRESDGSGRVSRFLEFTGHSAPERAAGLHRVGLIREIRRDANGLREFVY